MYSYRHLLILFGKQLAKDIIISFSLLQTIMREQDQLFYQRLPLLSTDLPNGFAGFRRFALTFFGGGGRHPRCKIE